MHSPLALCQLQYIYLVQKQALWNEPLARRGVFCVEFQYIQGYAIQQQQRVYAMGTDCAPLLANLFLFFLSIIT